MSADSLAVIVLAAGAGTRMKSDLPKPLHPVAGRPMLDLVLQTGLILEPVNAVVVASPDLAARWSPPEDVTVVQQDPPRGTGDAVRIALEASGNTETALVLYADHPVIDSQTLANLIEHASKSEAVATILTCTLPNAGHYGRIVRDSAGNVVKIAEKQTDDPAHRTSESEINSGIMLLNSDWASETLASLDANPQTGEYFLTDLVEAAASQGRLVDTIQGDPAVLVGINDRVELAAADRLIRDRIRTQLMLSGVTLEGPESIFIDASVSIGKDTVVLPGTLIGAGCQIGERCLIGPGTVLLNSRLGDEVMVITSRIVDSRVGDRTHIGPFSHIRAGSELSPDVHIGNFAEIKQSVIGPLSRIGHFSYTGDASIGEDTNIGAGTVTCNYDGTNKHRTTIGDHVFIGSDTMLVAPVVIGNDSRTGAGSVVTRDVPEGTTVVGIPARPIRKQSKEV